MSARARIVELARSSNVSTKFVIEMFDLFLEAVKEELIPKDQTFQEFFGLNEKPQLIQGYTAAQWSEIIDGGYLCEAKDCKDREWVPAVLKEIDIGDDEYPFKIKFSAPDVSSDDTGWDNYKYCRPAQIKGVMRPIFVEPVDKEAWCVFMWRDAEGGWGIKGDGQWDEFKKENSTAYIEL